MKSFLQIIGTIFLAYSVAGIGLHFLARMEILAHYCEELFVPAAENHLQVFTATAAIAAVLFAIAAAIKKRQLQKA